MRNSILERPELTRFIHSVNIQVLEIEVIGILGPGLVLGYDFYMQTIILIKVEVSDYITSFWLPVMTDYRDIDTSPAAHSQKYHYCCWPVEEP